jgi:protein-tyrosine kinase
MSIIEKVLDKQRRERLAETQADLQAQQAARRRQPPAPVADQARERGPRPRESISVSIESLRAEGILPAAAVADRLTEQFRRIKWPLLEAVVARDAAQQTPPPNVIMVTSSVADEGKTFTSFNLAMSIAREKDLEVLLIDADVAKQHLTRVLASQERPGLTEAVGDPAIDPEDLVVDTGIPGLSFLPAGRRIEHAPELFASQRMSEIVKAFGMGDRRRIVLFDSSPLLETNESQVLARLVDQIVLVVRAESTPQPVVLEAIGLLDQGRQIRCVLNQARTSHMTEYYYGYGYHTNTNDGAKK